MTAEKTLLTDVLELIDAWEGGIRTGDPDRGVNGDADKELAALAKVRAHIKQLETRCAELEEELLDCKAESAMRAWAITELRRDRERLDWLEANQATILYSRSQYAVSLPGDCNCGWFDTIRDAIESAIRRYGNE